MIYKKLLLLLPLSLIGCSSSEEDSSIERHYYSEIESISINYDEVFLKEESLYYIYYYQYDCLHCAQIRNKIIAFALKSEMPFYFVDIEEDYGFLSHTVEETIGTNDPLKAFCLTTPQLSIVENHYIKETYINNETIVNYLQEQ